MFKMEDRKSIKGLVQRFTSIVNHLMLLRRSFDNLDLVHKLSRSVTKEWQPKVITIKKNPLR